MKEDNKTKKKSCECKCDLECPVTGKSIILENISQLCSECINCILKELGENDNYIKLGTDDEIDYLKKLRDTIDQDIQGRLFEIDPETR